MAEKFIPGRELSVGVMGERALAVTEITTLREFYDFDAKYASGGSRHALPADLPERVTQAAMEASLGPIRRWAAAGVSRSDFRYDESEDRLVILETNTQPGMTPTSLVPEQAAFLGISFEELVAWMIEDASCPMNDHDQRAGRAAQARHEEVRVTSVILGLVMVIALIVTARPGWAGRCRKCRAGFANFTNDDGAQSRCRYRICEVIGLEHDPELAAGYSRSRHDRAGRKHVPRRSSHHS